MRLAIPQSFAVRVHINESWQQNSLYFSALVMLPLLLHFILSCKKMEEIGSVQNAGSLFHVLCRYNERDVGCTCTECKFNAPAYFIADFM